MGRRLCASTENRRALLIRLAPGVSLRPEPFGAVAYVAERDDFFALDQAHAAVARRAATATDNGVGGVGVGSVTDNGVGSVTDNGASSGTAGGVGNGAGAAVGGDDVARAHTLATLGICVTSPDIVQRPYLGRSLIGDFTELPVLDQPLVVNCFSTAHCPLLCTYCHADDLMAPFRAAERWSEIESVADTAALVPALVGVVTGGDPIVRPDRAVWLVSRLAASKRVVLDTSGAGDIEPLLPVLTRHRVHVRVSLDSADVAVNDRVRPASPAYLPRGASASRYAHATLRILLGAGVPCSVQTVVGSHNDDLDALRALRDQLLAIGVRHWVLHVAVPAGKAARHRHMLPGEGAIDRVRSLVAECVDDHLPLDIRLTGTHQTPNSVLLVDPRGRLCVERADGGGKKVIWNPADGGGQFELATRYRRYVDLGGHASRYLNGTLEPGVRAVPTGPAG